MGRIAAWKGGSRVALSLWIDPSQRRQVGMAAGPLTWPQIEAFFRLMRIRADEWELRALELLDNAWLESLAEERAGQK
ncbi:hypothetical protein H0A70_08085 [Alcaligenaceae bacterium]|nr:hypothetical protein [Alcaligenaceae bacterium]